ncbi:glycine betaine/L-proline ABC transporter permease/glycine betaine/L-proline-binding protein [Clostridium botulinum CFSAN001627]|uniref:Glycine betaine/L-proline ABC transporter permease/glycine betaine/L-proline-binding protein n=1 Tax=Clostridium botulinum CFSAN001627 TaxID=1232189 RepID=M1ZR29_CLOBO|nr:glycine betaine/L-proline ABC transporter permease/glycine betaine/L-proline-binding protein [Clostridium botulinum CFSAN001627]
MMQIPIVKEETLKKFPELREVLGKLDGKITDEKMRKLNYEVDVNKKDPKQVAKEFFCKKKG